MKKKLKTETKCYPNELRYIFKLGLPNVVYGMYKNIRKRTKVTLKSYNFTITELKNKTK